jgi:ketosteroid isomerase-like protein
MRKWLWCLAIVSTVAFPRDSTMAAPALSESTGAERQSTSRRVLEIRSYNLKPGTRDRFHQLFLKEALPMLKRWKVDVVGYGPSLHDKDSYFLMRAFDGVEPRQKSEDAFYGSDEWIKGPRERILADIDSYTTIVVHLDETTINGLRTSGGSMTGANDLEQLTKLNDDYIQSVQHSDIKRFNEILSDDFLCSMPDASLLDRKAFLDYTAKPVTITNLQAYDVNVRLMGDFAIIHAKTSYTAVDGTTGGGRYTDVWARRNGKWLAVSAHVTRR